MSRIALIAVVAAAVSGLACAGAGTGVPRTFPVPEDAENPIVLRLRGLTSREAVPVIARVCSDIPIPTAQVDPRRGYVETRWIDVAQYEVTGAVAALPLRERQIAFTFEVAEADEGMKRLAITAWYQPNRPTSLSAVLRSAYDRRVPTDHPGYQLALELEFRLRRALREAGANVVEN